MAPADLFRQQVFRIAFAFFGAFSRNVFQHHLHAAGSCGVSYTRAHHARTEYTYLLAGPFFHSARTAPACIAATQLEPEGPWPVLGDLTSHQIGQVAACN